MRRRLNLGFLVIILLLWAICVGTILNAISVRKDFDDLKGDIVPGVITMTRMQHVTTEIRQWTLTYIIRGSVIRSGKTIKEWLQEQWVALEEDARKHLEYERYIGLEEQRTAEEIVNLSQELISVSAEIVKLKDRGVGNDELFEKVRKEFGAPVFYPLREMLGEYTVVRLEKLSEGVSKVHGDNIKRTIILGLIATLVAIFVGLLVDRLFIRYVAEREQAKQELKESEEKFRRVIKTAPVVIWSQSIDTGEMYIMSPAVEKLTGYSPDDFKHNHILFWDTINSDGNENGRSYFFDKLIQNKEPQTFESRIIHKDGSTKIASVLISPGFNANCKLTRIDGIAIDITDKKILEEQIIQSEKMAAVGLLAAGVAHEFNNLLGGIMGNLSLAERYPDDARFCMEYIKESLKATERAADIVQSLLSFSRKKDDRKTRVQVVDLIEDMLKIIGKEIKSKSIKLIKNYHHIPVVNVMPNQLQQVFLNILINAIHAIDNEGIISISVWSDNGQVFIEIADNGAGIRKENLNKIFDPFFSTKGVWGNDKGKGTGLGLSISHNIIKNNGGNILVRSTPGTGTEFLVVLPECPVQKIALENLKLFNGANVLIVEFDLEQAVKIKNIITDIGGKPAVCSWSDKAIEMFKGNDFDLVIIDASHPAMADFVRLFDFLEYNSPSLPIVLTSRKPVKYQYEEYIKQAKGIIFKPFTFENVVNVLAKLNQLNIRASAGKVSDLKDDEKR